VQELDKKELFSAIQKGLPIAKQVQGLKQRYEQAKNPVLPSILVMASLLFWFQSSTTTKYEGISELLIQIIVAITVASALYYIPLVNLVYLFIQPILGMVLFTKKMKVIEAEIKTKTEKFNKLTTLPIIYCDTSILNKFLYYLESRMADNLKECTICYDNDMKHNQVLSEISSLEGEISNVANEVHRTKYYNN
jgi:hypothetical protein